jgi:catechol 2,3-dioxygenase-like lactoylglutathione lyase family enzyme
MKLAYTILYVRNVDESLAFYEAAFGVARRFLHESGAYGELDTGATTLAFASREMAASNLPSGFQPSEPSQPPGAFEIAFATPDVAEAYERAIRVGAASVAGPKSKPWGQVVAYVRDPDGHLVELCTPIQ